MEIIKQINHPLGYSKYEMFDQCERKYDVIHVSKLVGDTGKHNAAYAGQDVHKQLELYCKDEITKTEADLITEYLDIANKVKALKGEKLYEQQLAINKDFEKCEWFDKEDVLNRAIIDVLIINGKQAAAIDWKTGKKRDELVFQMELYALTIFIHYPEVEKIHTILYYLKDRLKSTKIFTRADMARIKQTVINKTIKIYETIDADSFKAKKSPLCKWCPFFERCDFK